MIFKSIVSGQIYYNIRAYIFNICIALLLAAMAVVATSCGDDPEPPVTEIASRTIVVYMAANNSLGAADCDSDDLEEMQIAARANAFGKGRLLVFYAPTDGSQTLYEIEQGTGAMLMLREYDDTQYVISASRMTEVLNDAIGFAPAGSYGLILWSHGLGWTQNGQVEPKTWGDDRGHSMNITTLADVLATMPFEWVYFDCCYMGSVEVMYQLRHAVDKVVASASEILLDGMPYQANLPLLFAETADLEAAAQNTFEYYDRFSGSKRTCTVGVFNIRTMDALAVATAAVYKASELVGLNDFDNLPLSVDPRPLFYDFGVYVNGMARVNNLPESMLTDWNEGYGKIVTFFRTTPTLWNQIDMSRFTGMSTYVMRTIADENYRNYTTLDWYNDVARYLYNK